MKIHASLLASKNWLCLEKDLKFSESHGADGIHIDTMDGHFVPNIAFGVSLVKAIRQGTTLPLNIHLMVSCLDTMLEAYIAIKPQLIVVHAEVAMPSHLGLIRKNGIKAGLALSPKTDVSRLDAFEGLFDHVLIMSVVPGFCGQKLMPETLEKIPLIRQRYKACECFVDGGVNNDNMSLIESKGATGVVMGAAFFRSR